MPEGLILSQTSALFDCRLDSEIMDLYMPVVGVWNDVLPQGLHSSKLSPLLFLEIIYWVTKSGYSHMWTHSVSFTGFQCGTKTSASSFLFVLPMSFSRRQFFLTRQFFSMPQKFAFSQTIPMPVSLSTYTHLEMCTHACTNSYTPL